MIDADRFVTSSANVLVVLKYHVVKWKEHDFAKVSPFLIEKFYHWLHWFSRPGYQKIHGALLLDILNHQHSTKLLKLQRIGDIDVGVIPHTICKPQRGGSVQGPT